MLHYEYYFAPIEGSELKEALIAGLLEYGFESFEEEEHALLAYLPVTHFDENLIAEMIFLKEHPEIKVEVNKLEEKNWNAEWEKNYPPVTIAGKCYVRAPFHPPMPGILYEIVIEPKMAFGTAHHATTQLMAEWLMDMDVKGKDVLDMGCGTGILAILANKMGARSVIGIDNDPWAWQNARENFRNGSIPEDNVLLGDAGLIISGQYDLILANINRNILIKDMQSYANGLRPGGDMLLSGFYQSDVAELEKTAIPLGMNFIGSKSLNDWAVMLLRKEKR